LNVRFTEVELDGCDGGTMVAIGACGSHAELKILPPRPCRPPP